MTINVKDMTRKELEKLKKQVDAQLVRLADQDKKKALAAAKKAAGALGFALDELIDTPAPTSKKKKAASKPKKAGAPKYAHPENPAVTWTGKGRQPVWFKEAIEAGKSPDDLMVK